MSGTMGYLSCRQAHSASPLLVMVVDVVVYVYTVTIKYVHGSFGNMLATPENIGEIITELREAKGWTMDRLTTEAGLSAGLVNRVERPRKTPNGGTGSNPGWPTIIKILNAMGAQVHVTFRKEEP